MAEYRKEGNIGIIELKNPPVNALSNAVNEGIFQGIEASQSDPEVQAVVVTGKGKCFCAGADIGGFKNPTGPIRKAVFETLEALDKPVVAAIHGYALGGGFELALASHYRVATKDALFGFPEVDIGILPGAGGTQRFPRVAGIKAALDIIPTGKKVKATQVAKWGAVDKLIDSNADILKAGIQYAKSVIGKPVAGVRSCDRTIPDIQDADKAVDKALAFAARKKKGLMAPVSCIKAVQYATKLPFSEGRQKEKDLFWELLTSGQAKAMQYAFFAQRAAVKWQLPDGSSSANSKANPVNSVAVIGSGTMGSGIAMTLLNALIPVILVEQDQKTLDAGVSRVRDLYSGAVKLGKLTQQQADFCMSQLTPMLGYDALGDVDVVIEAVFENMDLKKKIFAALDKVCKPTAVLCSNTSTLDINEMASATKRPTQVMGMHFFVPAFIMPLVENIYGSSTSGTTVATVTELSKRIHKVPVLVGNCNGFVANRIFKPYKMESDFLVEEGADYTQIDMLIRDFGMPMGPYTTTDLSGIDIGVLSQMERFKKMGVDVGPNSYPTHVNGERISAINKLMYDKGRMGRKTGAGFYKYDRAGGNVPYPDQEAYDIIHAYRQQKGFTPRNITPQEILERTLYSIINEGFRILEDGIVTKPQDIDTICLLGYGWPRQTGGPMFYAQTVGLNNVYNRLQHYHQQLPTNRTMQPSELLRRLAAADQAVPMSEWSSYVTASNSKL